MLGNRERDGPWNGFLNSAKVRSNEHDRDGGQSTVVASYEPELSQITFAKPKARWGENRHWQSGAAHVSLLDTSMSQVRGGTWKVDR